VIFKPGEPVPSVDRPVAEAVRNLRKGGDAGRGMPRSIL
jgi:hypothetical protein